MLFPTLRWYLYELWREIITDLRVVYRFYRLRGNSRARSLQYALKSALQ